MTLLNKVGNMVKNMGTQAEVDAEITRLNSKIGTDQKQIDSVYQKIGEFYYRKYQSGEPMPGEANAWFVEIDKHNATINEAKAEIERIKAERASAASATVSGTKCHSCGKVNAPGVKFCSECGTKLEPVQTPAPASVGIRCPSCGINNDADRKFCSECGTKLEPMATATPTPAPAPATGSVNCPKCGKVNMHGLNFCQECGAKLKPDTAPVVDGVFCPSCGSKNNSVRKFCSDCGKPLKA